MNPRIQELIAAGESRMVEFKTARTALNRDLYETICAFLNRDGGDILLGVKNDGTAQGVDPDCVVRMKEDFAAAINNPQKLNPPCYLSLQAVDHGGATLLHLAVPPSSQVHRCTNHIYLIHREYSNAFPAKFVIERNGLFTENANKPHGHGPIDPRLFSPFPKNPVIARVFKEIGLADELGSGVRRLFKYCKAYCGHDPELIEDDIFRLVLAVAEDAERPLEDAGRTSGKTSGKMSGKTGRASGKTSGKILTAMRLAPEVTIPELANRIGMTERSIERNISKLQADGRLRRIGPAKGGHWEVLP